MPLSHATLTTGRLHISVRLKSKNHRNSNTKIWYLICTEMQELLESYPSIPDISRRSMNWIILLHEVDLQHDRRPIQEANTKKEACYESQYFISKIIGLWNLWALTTTKSKSCLFRDNVFLTHSNTKINKHYSVDVL